jgi:hypothetical protein
MVLGDEARRRRGPDVSRPGSRGWRCVRSRPWRRRDQVNPQAGRDCVADAVCRRRGSPTRSARDRRAECLCALQLVRADVAGEPRLRRGGGGLEADRVGATGPDGKLPVNMSGGVLSSNPIGASGMLRFAEAAMQVRGQAGEHQVDGVRRCAGPRLRRRLAVLCHVGGPSVPWTPPSSAARPRQPDRRHLARDRRPSPTREPATRHQPPVRRPRGRSDDARRPARPPTTAAPVAGYPAQGGARDGPRAVVPADHRRDLHRQGRLDAAQQADGSRGAHSEHTVAITPDGPIILTARD